MVVFYPTPNVYFQATGGDSIEQAILFERRATSASQDRARKWQARANQAGHLRLFLVLTRMSPPQKHVYVLEARKACERRWGKRSQHSYHFFFFLFLIIAIITGIPSGSLCGGERRGAPERETRNDWGAVAPV